MTHRATTEPTASIRPLVGPRSLGFASAVFALWVIATAVLQVRTAGESEPIQQRMFQVGWIYGALSGSCWIASAVTRRSVRLGIFAAGILLAALWLSSNRPPERHLQGVLSYLTIGSGLVIAQGVIFYLLRIPFWRRSHGDGSGERRHEWHGVAANRRSSPQQESAGEMPPGSGLPLSEDREARQPAGSANPSEHQYSIAGILAATTAMAILLTLAERYAPPIDPRKYWAVMVGIWVWLPLLSALIAHASLRRRRLPAAALAAAAIAVAAAGAAGLATLELRLNDQLATLELRWNDQNAEGPLLPLPPAYVTFVTAYATFAAAYAATVAAVALAGRAQAKASLGGEQAPPGGP